MATNWNVLRCPPVPCMKNSAVPTRPAASPPNACESAVRCGTAVSGTCASGTPTTKPAMMATRMMPWPVTVGSAQVARMASDMPATPARTPLRAVFGSFIQWSAKMKSAVAAT